MPATAERPQHMEALALANHKRLTRAAFKRNVKAGEVSVAEVVEDYPDELDTMAVYDLLRSAERWGKIRAHKFLRSLGISERRTFAELSERQRALLAGEMRSRGWA